MSYSFLNIARDNYREAHQKQKCDARPVGTFIWTPDQAIQVAQAAALIAIAERQPRFVQVGRHRINVDAITDIEEVCDTTIIVYTGHVGAVELQGPDKTAFLLWHEQHADVERLDVEA